MIYFVQTEDNQFVKIGYAGDVSKRLAGLQTSSPQTLKLIGTQPGDHGLERRLHERFGYLRTRGEWFATSTDLLEYIVQAGALNATGIADDDPFLRYCALDGRLAPLFVEAATTKAEPGEPFCANAVFFGYGQPRTRSIKWRLSKLVGWYADAVHPDLRSPKAYDACYERIYEALPDCRWCSCAPIADLVG